MTRIAPLLSDAGHDNAAVARLSRLARLSPPEIAIVRTLGQTARHASALTELGVEGRVQPPAMLLTGWACHQRILGDGRRQIVRFLLPGDVIGSLIRPSLPVTSTTMALTSVTLADARPLIRTTGDDGEALPGLADAVAAMAYVDEINLRNQVVRLGRQTAYERLVHLLLEFHYRLGLVGLVDGESFPLPLTQEILADALGLSVVHINRTLQQVRRDRLLNMRSGQVTLCQPDLMRATADWAPPALG